MLFPENGDENAQQWFEAKYPEPCLWNKTIGISSEKFKSVSVPFTRSIHALASVR
jgi:hypothetical protein